MNCLMYEGRISPNRNTRTSPIDTLSSIKAFLAHTGLSKSTLRRMSSIAGTGPVRVEIGRRVLKAERDAAGGWMRFGAFAVH
jgi:hypothetical protein